VRRGTRFGDCMNFGRWIIRMLKLLAPPVILASIAAFFVWHASHGDRGLIAREQRIVDIAQAKSDRDRAVAEREAAERRVNAMRGDRLDRDQLEERARAMLNLTTREEIVIPYPAGQRLF
jgi:cell division protein FtsB